MESNVRGAHGPLAAGGICNWSRVMRQKMHGCFPRIIYKLNEPDRKCVLYVLTTCTRKPIHTRKKLVLTTVKHFEPVVACV